MFQWLTINEEDEERRKKMPCLNISTNVSLEGVDTSSILSEATSSIAKLIGKPESVTPLSSPHFMLFCLTFLSYRLSSVLVFGWFQVFK